MTPSSTPGSPRPRAQRAWKIVLPVVFVLIALGVVVAVIAIRSMPGSIVGDVGLFGGTDPPPASGDRSALARYGMLVYIAEDGLRALDATGRRPRLLATVGARSPLRWSPDGRRLAFSDGTDLYVVPADGRGMVRLTHGAGRNIEPAWSPDSTRLVFASNRAGDFDLYVMHGDGTGTRRLTRTQGADHAPAWSSRGQIAFEARRSSLADRHGAIAVMNEDGSDRHRLTELARTAAPTWSPDGKRLAFVGREQGTRIEKAYVINADGHDLHALGEDYIYNPSFGGQEKPARRLTTPPVWSPDGRRIAFSTGNTNFTRDGMPYTPEFNLYLADPGGSGTEDEGELGSYGSGNGVTCFDPTWSTDSDKLVFVRGAAPYLWSRHGFPAIYGFSHIRRLADTLPRITDRPRGGESLAWQPLARQ